MIFNNGHWQYNQQMGSQAYVGFVYVIKDKIFNTRYIGKKSYRSSGKHTAGKESLWRSYKTSSPHLKEHFKERPLTEFEFIVLSEYKTKSGLAWAETWSLCFVEAPLSSRWLNRRVEAIQFNVKEPVTEYHKEILRSLI
jgi:hypothetical protein